MFDVLAGFGIFAITVGYNFVFALYQDASQQGKPLRAANLDTALFVMGAVSLGALFLVGWWVLVPEAVGNWVGTYAGTRYAVNRRA